jgi:predicted GNAT family N-acyltransferase
VATQPVSLEAVHGEDYPQKRMPPRRIRLGGMAQSLKQVCGPRAPQAGKTIGRGRPWLLPAGVATCGLMTSLRSTGTAVYEIRRAQGRQELAAALELRHDVFCIEQGVPERDELDGRDHDGIHLVAVRDGELLATCRILLVGSTAQFSRLAVKLSARRRGIATALLALADDEARSTGARRIVLHAQTYARELYENAGYRPRGRVFWEAGIEHIAMEKVLD